MQCLADARTHYVCNTYNYCGKGFDTLEDLIPEKKLSIRIQAAIRLCNPIFGSNTNVTADNWYSSVQLVEVLF